MFRTYKIFILQYMFILFLINSANYSYYYTCARRSVRYTYLFCNSSLEAMTARGIAKRSFRFLENFVSFKHTAANLFLNFSNTYFTINRYACCVVFEVVVTVWVWIYSYFATYVMQSMYPWWQWKSSSYANNSIKVMSQLSLSLSLSLFG